MNLLYIIKLVSLVFGVGLVAANDAASIPKFEEFAIYKLSTSRRDLLKKILVKSFVVL